MKPAKINKFLFVFIILFFLIACNKINEDKLSKIYVELIISKEKAIDSLDFLIRKDKILKKYNVKEDEYIDAIMDISLNSIKWDKFNDKALEYLDTLSSKAIKRENVQDTLRNKKKRERTSNLEN